MRIPVAVRWVSLTAIPAIIILVSRPKLTCGVWCNSYSRFSKRSSSILARSTLRSTTNAIR